MQVNVVVTTESMRRLAMSFAEAVRVIEILQLEYACIYLWPRSAAVLIAILLFLVWAFRTF